MHYSVNNTSKAKIKLRENWVWYVKYIEIQCFYG